MLQQNDASVQPNACCCRLFSAPPINFNSALQIVSSRIVEIGSNDPKRPFYSGGRGWSAPSCCQPGWAMDPHKLANVVDRTQLPQFIPNLEFNTNIGNEDGDHDSSQAENSESINQMIQTLKEGINSLPPGFQMQQQR